MSTALTYAQQAEKDLNPQDPKAQSILDALSDKASAYKSFTADFEYTLINKTEGINETQKGKVTMKGKKKYKLEVAGQEIVCNGETVWTFIKDAGELQISDVPEESEEDGNIMNPANATPGMVCSSFASGNTNTGDFPPSSSDTFFRFPADA